MSFILPASEPPPLDDAVRSLFLLQSQAIQAAQAQIDALHPILRRVDALELRGSDAGEKPAPPKTPSRNSPREATFAALGQLEAHAKREDDQDEPAATYDRVRYAAIALALIELSLFVIAIFTGGIHGKAFQVTFLMDPLVVTGLSLLFYGTLDSSAMAAAATRTFRSLFIVYAILVAVVRVAEGPVFYAQAALSLVYYWFSWAYYATWFLSAARERMRKRFKGTLSDRAHHYTSRLLEIASFQAALMVQGLAQGIGTKSIARNRAIYTFSQSLAAAWVLSSGVFDAGDTDPKRATKLRLSFSESAALAASALYVFTGLAGYVMAEQGDPDASAAQYVIIASSICVLVAAVLVGRLIARATKKDAVRVRPSGSECAA